REAGGVAVDPIQLEGASERLGAVLIEERVRLLIGEDLTPGAGGRINTSPEEDSHTRGEVVALAGVDALPVAAVGGPHRRDRRGNAGSGATGGVPAPTARRDKQQRYEDPPPAHSAVLTLP